MSFGSSESCALPISRSGASREQGSNAGGADPAEKARRPALDYPRLRVAWFSGLSLTEGIETHRVEQGHVRVYSAAKTVADCFKYRHKVGIDVAVEMPPIGRASMA